MRLRGRICRAFTIAASSPASTASARNAEFSTRRAAGFSPNDTFETPRIVCVPGSSVFTRRIASSVAIASPRRSSCPPPSGNVSMSNSRSPGSIPYRSTAISWMRCATRSFQSTSRACPSSSMTSATAAAPNRLISGSSRVIFRSPSSKLMEFTIPLPPYSFSAVSITGTSVESNTRGSVACVRSSRAKRSTSGAPSRPT